MGVNLISALWGFSEAIFFFIVPDLWLSIAGRDDLRAGLRACLYALMGALIGGSIGYFWGAHDHSSALAVMERIPAVSTDMIGRVRTELIDRGAWAILFGPVSGTPYKLYAAQAADAGISFWLFFDKHPGAADSLCLGYSILPLRAQTVGLVGRQREALDDTFVSLGFILSDFLLGDAKLTEWSE
ncbi:MAG TPA: hypothetical protein VGW77_08945 [Candidatus Binatia bacterium]|jgi:membrane protein YqaA with SNARE-associated domain|nr:hypothetical protein [Candidatus Binatia bacterium]